MNAMPKLSSLEDDVEEEVETIIAEDTSSYPFEYVKKPASLTHLLELGRDYLENKTHDKIRFNINLKLLGKLVPTLEDLTALIGLSEIKNDIYEQIVYNLLELDNKSSDMWHTVIQGSPGVGKTELANVLAKVYAAFGITKHSRVLSLKRDDLIAGYVGQTAIKAREKFNKAKGGVLLLDEAYSLGDDGGKDTFSKQMLDLLNAFLSENPDTVCIATGYKKALEEQFFAMNEGLKRRFSRRFEIKDYSAPELRLILFKIIRQAGWHVENEEDFKQSFFEKNKPYFRYNGGDMLTLFGCSKKSHAMRLLEIETEDELNNSRKHISFSDIEGGMEIFLKNPEHKGRNVVDTFSSFYT